MWHVKKYRITTEKMRERFNNMPSVQTLCDVRTMDFLGSLVRGQVNSPPRQLLIAFLPNKRPVGRPIKCNKESMWSALRRLLQDINGIHVDRGGSLVDWYLDALDDSFWNKCIGHLRDPQNIPAPERPNRDAEYHRRRSRRNRRQDQNANQNSNGSTSGANRGRNINVSPPPET